MASYSFADIDFVETGSLVDTIDVRETYWGTIVREDDLPDMADTFLGGVFRALGALSIVTGAGFWLMPGMTTAIDVLAIKIVITLLLLALGLVLFIAAQGGYRPEVHFDTTRREIRFASRNGQGRTRLTASVAMDHITGVTVEPIVQGSEYAEMRLTIDGVDEGLLVVSGRRGELDPVAARLRRDLRTASQRVEDKLAAFG